MLHLMNLQEKDTNSHTIHKQGGYGQPHLEPLMYLNFRKFRNSLC